MSQVATLAELPRNKVVIKGGKVIRVDEWCLWNGTPWMTVQISREGKEFCSHIGDPEHGGGSAQGSLEEVLEPFHPDIRAKYLNLFGLKNPDETAINNLGLLGCEIEQS